MASAAGPPTKRFKVDMDNISSLPEISLSLLSSEDYEPTSTLQYVNSQLVAHGFTSSPGLSFDGLANNDSERLVKCLLGMLSQRMEDLARTEELSSKLRTLTYEHERLQSMHRAAADDGANAEREMNLFKSKLAASQRSFTSETFSHKQTLSDLQRTRTSLQYLRSTTQNELKRKDKEVERVLERWNKVIDTQAKLLNAHSGLRCANLAVGIEAFPRGKGLMEEALEQAEEARYELIKENEGFRSVILGTANALQGIVYNMKNHGLDPHVEEPTPLSHTAIFAPPTSLLQHPENAHAKIREIMSSLRDAISSHLNFSRVPANTQESETEELAKLKDLVSCLRNELDQSRQSSTTIATQAQAVLDRFTTHASERLITGRDPTPEEAAEMSMELIGVPECDELREKIDRRVKELEAERGRFTEATVKFGKEKAALEAERIAFLEEKRRWSVEQMLAELPPTPGPDPDLVFPPGPSKTQLKQNSPSPPHKCPWKPSRSRVTLKSPLKKNGLAKLRSDGRTLKKLVVGKMGSEREEHFMGIADVLGNRQDESDNVNDDPNGLQRSTTPEDSPPVAANTTIAAEMKTSLPLVLPTTFTLPPPSPASSLAALDLGPISSDSCARQSPLSPTAPSFDAIPLTAAALPPAMPFPRPRTFPSPRTPRTLVNAHMKHAYSPARPSPLSTILMIADSPPSPRSVPPIEEEDEETTYNDVAGPSLELGVQMLTGKNRVGELGELKLGAPIDEPSPLCARTGGNLNGKIASNTSGKDTSGNDGEKRFTAKEKGKARVVPIAQGVTAMEKENVVAGTQASRVVKAKASVSSKSGNVNLGVKSIKSFESETRNPAAMGKPCSKPPSASSAVALKTTTWNGLARPSVGATQSGTGIAGAAVVRPGGSKRVLIGSVNAGRLGAKRI